VEFLSLNQRVRYQKANNYLKNYKSYHKLIIGIFIVRGIKQLSNKQLEINNQGKRFK
jgi:hypothetical protein